MSIRTQAIEAGQDYNNAFEKALTAFKEVEPKAQDWVAYSHAHDQTQVEREVWQKRQLELAVAEEAEKQRDSERIDSFNKLSAIIGLGARLSTSEQDKTVGGTD